MDNFLKKSTIALRKKRYKITPQRIAVLKAVGSSPSSVSIILEKARAFYKNIDLASVYRILELFVRLNIVQRINFDDMVSRYERLSGHHHHIICERCHAIEEVSLECEDKLLKRVHKNTSFKIYRHSLEFYGVCQSCK